ncbi:MAG: hypothetical protein KF847_04205 [Pirellulales bacterium]|nr:hypothetical protein [Pirellulales bacterium]
MTPVSSEAAVRRATPSALGLAPSFGFGDRLGVATPGHLAALREAGGPIRGIFAQQSIREMTRTQRSPEEVMRAAASVLRDANFDDPWSADADHLKTPEDIRSTAAAGFVFFTLDPSDEVDQQADGYDAATLAAKFAEVRDSAPWFADYSGRVIRMVAGTITLDETTLMRAAVKYGRAIQRAIDLSRAVETEAKRLRQPFEIELSVDETAEPTTPAEHFIIADQLQQAGVRIVSLAPRFVGEFEKGIDYRGDVAELEQQLRLHAEIAAELGPYKLSLHSGSDKLSMYSQLAQITRGRFHVKTAGTSYLEAIRVAARQDERFFREIIDFSRMHYDRDKATYHVSARVEDAPSPDEVLDVAVLERIYLDQWSVTPHGKGFTEPGRQILHCTFGSVLTDPRLGPMLSDLLATHLDTYTELLRDHFQRHLRALQWS